MIHPGEYSLTAVTEDDTLTELLQVSLHAESSDGTGGAILFRACESSRIFMIRECLILVLKILESIV